jgi:hypothetical protein
MKKSSAAQKLANLYPDWSAVRSDEQSLGFQLFNVIGQSLDSIDQSLIKQKANYYLSTANVEEIDLVHRLDLSPSFVFQSNSDDSNFTSFTAPTVSGLIGDTWYSVSLAENNDVESFWYTSSPNRYSSSVTVSGTHVVLEPTQLTESPITSFTSDINFPGYLHVTVSGGTTFLSVDNEQPSRGIVRLEGVTRKGTEESESIVFLFDDTKTTEKEWQSLSKVSIYGIDPSTATIKITSLKMNAAPQLDAWNTDHSVGGAKVDSFWAIGLTTSGTTLDYMRYVSDNYKNLLAGIIDKEAVRRVELMNTSGVAITATDLAIQPLSDKIWVVTSSDLLLFNRSLFQPDTSVLTKKQYDSIVKIEVDSYYKVLGETLSVSYRFVRPVKDLAKHRATIQHPNGQKYGVVNGSLVTFNNDAWVFGAVEDRLLRNDDVFEMSERGDWIFTLEALMSDSTLYVDQIIVSVQTQSAAAGFSMPFTISGVSLDSDGAIWVGDTDGVKHRIDLATDQMMIDYDQKTIYFKEQYEDIGVTS